MSEEEIIKEFKDLIYNPVYDEILLRCEDGFTGWHELFENVLDLYNKEKEKNKELEKMLKLKSHKRKYNTMNYIKKNKLNKFDMVGICQDMRAFKRTGEIKYRAYITFQNKQYTLGTYTSLEKAKEARKKGEIMVENIKKNFVEKIKGEE